MDSKEVITADELQELRDKIQKLDNQAGPPHTLASKNGGCPFSASIVHEPILLITSPTRSLILMGAVT